MADEAVAVTRASRACRAWTTPRAQACQGIGLLFSDLSAQGLTDASPGRAAAAGSRGLAFLSQSYGGDA